MENQDLATYIETLVKEKGRVFDAPLPQFEKVGHINLSYSSLVEFVKTMPNETKKEIKTVLVSIDFKNADVFDFLDHLLNGMIAATEANQYGGYAETKCGQRA